MRLIIANLLAEWRLTHGTRQPPERVRRAAAALGTLMRVLAEPGDVLWLEAPLDEQRLPALPGIAKVRLAAGGLETFAPRERPHAVLAWAETPRIAALRRRCGLHDPAADRAAAAFRRATDRRWQLALARSLGWALPGARAIDTAQQLASALGRPLSERWVLKKVHSAAGRERHIGKGVATPADLRRAHALLREAAALVLEPWLPRTADIGIAAHLEASGAVRVLGLHTQLVDGYGRFRSLTVPPVRDDAAVLREGECAVVRRVLAHAGAALLALGHSGPVGLDLWRWRPPTGAERLQPLGELNPRYTIGRLAHQWCRRLQAAGLLSHAQATTLQLRAPSRTDTSSVPLLWAGRSQPETGIALTTS